MTPSVVHYLLALQLYRRCIETPTLPFWRWTAAAEVNDDGFRLLDTLAARWRRQGFRTKIVSLPLEKAAYQIHHDHFALFSDFREWQVKNPGAIECGPCTS